MSVVASSHNMRLPDVGNPQFWKELNPELQITDYPAQQAAARYQIAAPDMREPVRQIVQEGYTELPPLIPSEETARLADAIQRLHLKGLPAVFAYVYDEFWQVYANLAEVLAPIIAADHKIQTTDIWIWYVDRNQVGFKPHRDFVSDDAVRPDGRPALLTIWIPLTDVTPLNGCLYVLPTDSDPNLPGHGRRAPKLSLDDLQNIRALPAVAGTVFCWNSHLLHWGARSSDRADQPRISMGVYLQHSEYPEHYPSESFVLNAETALPFDSRLEVVCRAIRIYRRQVLSQYPNMAEQLLEFAGQVAPPRRRSRWPFQRRGYAAEKI